jgi:hypothetical protein
MLVISAVCMHIIVYRVRIDVLDKDSSHVWSCLLGYSIQHGYIYIRNTERFVTQCDIPCGTVLDT